MTYLYHVNDVNRRMSIEIKLEGMGRPVES